MDVIIALKPSSVIDVGAGFGKYGVLCREYLDLWNERQQYESVRRIDAVEVFNKYITPLHEFIYTNIYTENILKLVDKLDFSYDLVLVIDVLEHFNKEEGMTLVRILLSKNNGILISTPKDPSPQKDVFGNVHEIHRSRWQKQELLNIGECYFISDNISIIVHMTKEHKSFNNLEKKLKLLKTARSKSSKRNLRKHLASIPLVRDIHNVRKKLF
jgi:2-polyprenyl-3-methyl-5-hydroxy-6-metoxy-1,4-benzoquinol methylase